MAYWASARPKKCRRVKPPGHQHATYNGRVDLTCRPGIAFGIDGNVSADDDAVSTVPGAALNPRNGIE